MTPKEIALKIYETSTLFIRGAYDQPERETFVSQAMPIIAAAVAEEREACAHIADDMDSGTEVDIGVGILHNPRDEVAREIATLIRARSKAAA